MTLSMNGNVSSVQHLSFMILWRLFALRASIRNFRNSKIFEYLDSLWTCKSTFQKNHLLSFNSTAEVGKNGKCGRTHIPNQMFILARSRASWIWQGWPERFPWYCMDGEYECLWSYWFVLALYLDRRSKRYKIIWGKDAIVVISRF